MQKRLNAVIQDFELLKNKKILVACSTGIDSMVLLDLCLKYLNKETYRNYVRIYNYYYKNSSALKTLEFQILI